MQGAACCRAGRHGSKNLRAGPRHLSEREALDLAAPVGEWLISQYRDNPSDQKLWPTEYGEAVFVPQPPIVWGDGSDFKAGFAIRDGDLEIMRMEQWCKSAAAEISSGRGLKLDETAVQLISRSIARIMQAAGLKLKRLTEGEREDVVLRFAGQALPRGPATKAALATVPFIKLIDGWSAERRPAEKTLYDWTRTLKELATFVRHDNASAVTADDLIRWKSAMVTKGLKAKTIQMESWAQYDRSCSGASITNSWKRTPLTKSGSTPAASRVKRSEASPRTKRKSSCALHREPMVLSGDRCHGLALIQVRGYLKSVNCVARTSLRLRESCVLRLCQKRDQSNVRFGAHHSNTSSASGKWYPRIC